jgi:hypothetical protein
VTAQVNDDLMEFPEAYGPGRHFQYKNQPARLSKLITIDSDTDLPAVTLQGNEIWFEAEFTIAHSSGVEVYLDGVLWQKQNNVRVQTADRIEFRDEATGTTAFWWLGFPKAYDSDGDETIGQMEVRRQGGPTALFITVRIPKLWIDSAIFPIFIDPTLDTSVGASGDDGEWQDGGSFDNTTHIITMGDAFGQAWNSFTRFDNLTFSGTIDVAYATFDAEITRSNSTLNIVIRAVDTNDPAAPTTHSEADSPSAGRTTAAGNWAPGNQTAGTSYDTSSIVSVIQELLDSAYTYDGTQAIVLHFLHDGSDVWIDETSFDDPTQSAPALHIEYTAAGGDSTPYLSGLRKRRFQPQIVR